MFIAEFADIILIDSNHRINIVDYSLYTLLVRDENGFGQPVAISLMVDDKNDTLRKFIRLFKLHNPSFVETRVFFVDNNFGQLDVFTEGFLEIPAWICAFHTVKTIKVPKNKQQKSFSFLVKFFANPLEISNHPVS